MSPGFDSSIVDIAAEAGVLGIPGIATATELMQARNLGVDVVKFFPAEAAGGLAALRALAAAFPDVRFVPTGGISGANGRRYLDESFVAAVGGSWMIDDTALATGDWEAITDLQHTLRGHHSVLLVSAAPIFGVKLIETIQRVFTWLGKPLVVDAENWMAHPGTAGAILNVFRHPRTPQHFVVPPSVMPHE